MTTRPPAASAPVGALTRRPLKVRVHLALRTLHLYTSMLALMLMLFFAVSGILLNHPGWLPQGPERQRLEHGTLPASWQHAGQPDWFRTAEYLRATHHLGGRAGDERLDDSSGDGPGGEASLSFQGPGYSADVRIDAASGRYEIDSRSEGLLAVIGDLHRGRHTGPVWPWLIDVSGAFMVLIALSGLGILVYMKKYRRPALLTLGGGAAVGVVLAVLAM